ncbi:dihydrolipoamide acetyltransferase family protein [Natronolimnohabitans innermongolicus]|uniref:Branched-chain alpha-keto acid dehydrogenase subunit E2 n=1 Tax=Natronolimnohabitans innermongolicus JCM 12255 TaxID=1227499 RepID=L9WL95_9EURY|nr:dihydrolipoamide acetyltransferase family protein [Natronolimnohabitans innermongolicus]ELY50147.1 branched-chain alpha-keto acid dehydrogenase subunit E2 [Natronolimnohabitans innermongolicus JCM 12255]
MQEIKLPKLGQAMEEGLVDEWCVNEGDSVSAGDTVVIIESEKTVHELPADQDGRLLRKLIGEGETVPIGTTLGYVGTADEASEISAAPDSDSAAKTPTEKTQAELGQRAELDGRDEPIKLESPQADESGGIESATESPDTATTADGSINATPNARKAAQVHDVDVTAVGSALGVQQVQSEHVGKYVNDSSIANGGTEIRGSPAARRIAADNGVEIAAVGEELETDRVRMADIDRYLERKAEDSSPTDDRNAEPTNESNDPSPTVHETVSVTGGRKVMYDRMQTVSRDYGSTTTVARVDVTQLTSLTESLKEPWQKYHDVSPSITAFVLRAVAEALPEYRILNAEIVEGDGSGDDPLVRQFEDVNLGVAVDTEHGLLVPTIYGADERSAVELGERVTQLAEQARNHDLEMDQQQNATFTVSNAGTFGAYINTPQINPPQTGILGVCTVNEEPGIVDDEVVPRKIMHLCLTYDHRVVEGSTAVQFLQAVKHRLEDPHSLLS